MSREPDPTLSVFADSAGDEARILVIDGSTSSIVTLPGRGTVTIGRAPECELRLADPACSRRHAELHVDDGAITFEDLGSHNGTRINGERVTGQHPLTSDDVISIGPIKLVLHMHQRPRRTAMLDAPALRTRLAQEVERAVTYDRPFAIAVITTAGCTPGSVAAIVAAARLVDIVGQLDDRHLIVAMPELPSEAAVAAATRMLETLGAASSVGLATCPSDACSAEALIAAARSAAAQGPGVHDAAECVRRLALAGGTTLVADAAMLQIFDLVRRLAPSDLSVLITGETGSGKENVAHALHEWSARSGGPFVAINCASLPETLVESELFGYDKGAFSGAVTSKPGRLEAAHGGTVFFDEIGELALAAQAKLLRALEARKVTRLGGLRETALDVRVVVATNRDLELEVKAGRFREDLYFRLSGATVALPPLRQRPRELAILARFFLERACLAANRVAPELSAATAAVLGRHAWPGNVRELRNEMDYVAATAHEDVVEPWHLSERIAGMSTPATVPARSPTNAEPPPSTAEPADQRFRPVQDELRDLERRRMTEALAAAGGVQKRAAELIGMPLRTFTMKYKQYGLGGR